MTNNPLATVTSSLKNFSGIYWKTRFFLERYPSLYLLCLKIERSGHLSRKWIIQKNTDIVIEGFPCSANTFAVQAFHFAQNRSFKIAHHMHSSTQIIKAYKLNCPALVLIRNPYDAISSRIAVSREEQIKTRQNYGFFNCSIENYILYYIKFYEKIKSYKDYFIVGAFNDVVSDFGKIIALVNSRFNTNFFLFEHNAENVKKIFNNSQLRARPSAKRNVLKEKIKSELDNKALSLMKKACAVYSEYITYGS